jgi:hypothetical protein
MNKTIVYHPPTTKDGRGYYTLTFGKKWFSSRKKRINQQKHSRKANRP